MEKLTGKLSAPGALRGSLSIYPYGDTPTLVTLEATENGTYTPAAYSADGFGRVDVAVVIPAPPTLVELEVNENGHYYPDFDEDGFSEVIVNVPIPEPVLDSLSVIANGIYTPPTGVDGYNNVNVNVPTPEPITEEIYIDANGIYAPEPGIDGFSEVEVNVPTPQPVLQPLNVTQNGTYAPQTGVDGFSTVEVDVPEPGTPYKHYRLYITNFARNNAQNQTFQNIAEFQVIGDGGRNIAHDNSIAYSASSTHSSSNPANAFDEDPEIIWESDWTIENTTGWIAVELDKPRVATGFRLTIRPRYTDCPYNALIQGSNDGENWTTLYTIAPATVPTGGWYMGMSRDFVIKEA